MPRTALPTKPDPSASRSNIAHGGAITATEEAKQDRKRKREPPIESDQESQQAFHLADEEPYTIKCICDFSEDDGNTIYCEKCDTWQHIECFYPGRLEEASREEFEHWCADCKPQDIDGRHTIAGSLDLKTMIEISVQAARRKRQNARQWAGLQKQLLGKHGSKGASNDREESDASEYHEESASGEQNSWEEEQDGSDTDEPEQEQPEADRSEQTTPNDVPLMDQSSQNEPITTVQSSMSAQEKKLWAMNFEELYKYAVSKNFGKIGKESRKSGRIKIIKWLCDKQGITQYVAPTVTSVEATPIIGRPNVTPSGAISHPEAILRTSDPALQHLIDEKEQKYKKVPHAQLTELAMERSYQLFKDSQGKLPSKSISAMSQWLAAWDVLKSPREKRWWLSDGIDLVNRAKAMGYQGPSRKYDVIVWLRSTPEDAEIEVADVAVPTPNKKLEAKQAVSKRHAKGSKRLRC